MNKPDIFEVQEKQRRVRKFLEKTGYEAVVLGRKDNFAWYTCGGSNKVLISTEQGFSILVITKDKTYVVAHVMDGPRVMEEELGGLDFEPVFIRWYECSREEKVTELIRGLKAISDFPVAGADFNLSEIYKLHYPLTDKEMEKLRWIGGKSDEIIRKVADAIKPGMAETEIEAMLHYEYVKNGMTMATLMVGSDERISKFRHPITSDKKVDRLVMLHPAASKWGLHAVVSRMLYFGDKLPEETAAKYEAACSIETTALSLCRPGTKFSDIMEAEKKAYRETGFEEEWRNHFMGGISGYLLADATLCLNPRAEVTVNQSYDWFITITGVKVEELTVNTEKGREFFSATGKWPTKAFEVRGETYQVPQILLR